MLRIVESLFKRPQQSVELVGLHSPWVAIPVAAKPEVYRRESLLHLYRQYADGEGW